MPRPARGPALLAHRTTSYGEGNPSPHPYDVRTSGVRQPARGSFAAAMALSSAGMRIHRAG